VSRRPRRDRGDWVSLIDGVRVSRGWMSRHTPQLLTAWCEARTREQRRAVAARILRIATYLESEPDLDEPPPDPTWRTTVERIDTRLLRGPDWPPLAAALARAAAAGYDVANRLPTLAASPPLPDRHPARELHWRLLDDCPAALLTLSAVESAVHTSTGRPQLHRDAPPTGRDGAASAPTFPYP
jgi:hypothetical protein